MFRRLGVFAGGFTMEDGPGRPATKTSMNGPCSTLLAALVEKSLVVAEAGELPLSLARGRRRAFALEQWPQARPPPCFVGMRWR